MDDYELDDIACPFCNHAPIYFQECPFCEDGYVDAADEDPVNFAEGEDYEVCLECSGQGHIRWCPKCGKDIWNGQIDWSKYADVHDAP